MRRPIVDRIVSFFSPAAGAARVRSRIQEAALSRYLERSYEAASRGRRTAGMKGKSTSANAEIFSALEVLRNRSRELCRNNAYASRAVEVIVANTVGAGITMEPKSSNARQAATVAEYWSRWAETTACDADGLHDIYGLQALVMSTVVESGECLVRRRPRRTEDNLPVPLQIQVIEPDLIDIGKDGTTDSGRIIQGIEFNGFGKRVAYWVFDSHPGDHGTTRTESRRIPADQILHVFRGRRPGQVRAVPWGAQVFIKLADFDQYEDAQLVKQKISACFAGFIVDSEAPLDPQQAAEEVGDKIEPGILETLPPGKDIRFPNPPQVANYSEYSRQILHGVAVAYGVSYEALTGDYSQATYSAARMGWLEFSRNIEQWRWLMLIPQFCLPVFEWFLAALALKGIDTDGVTVECSPPRREMIDPTREVPATTRAIRAGIKTLSEAIREQGYDPRKHLEEMKRDTELLDEFGLILDSDPRRMSLAGQPHRIGGEDGNSEEDSSAAAAV